MSRKRQKEVESHDRGTEGGVRIQLETEISPKSVVQRKHVRGLGNRMSQEKQQRKRNGIYSNNPIPVKPVPVEAIENQYDLLGSSSYSREVPKGNSFISYNKEYLSETEGSDCPGEHLHIDDGPETDEDTGDMRNEIVVARGVSPPRTPTWDHLKSVSIQSPVRVMLIPH